jgi:hypothetical protein
MGFLDSHTPLASARAGPLLRGFRAVGMNLAHFMHLHAHRVGAMTSDCSEIVASPTPLALAYRVHGECAARGSAPELASLR